MNEGKYLVYQSVPVSWHNALIFSKPVKYSNASIYQMAPCGIGKDNNGTMLLAN
jgi:hypothetical protein